MTGTRLASDATRSTFEREPLSFRDGNASHLARRSEYILNPESYLRRARACQASFRMPRVSFAKSQSSVPPLVDETSPLIQPRTLLPTLAEEDEDLHESPGAQIDKRQNSLGSLSSQKLRRGILIAREGVFSGDRTYLPFHRRRRVTEPRDVPTWKILAAVVGTVVLLGCIVVACIALNTIQHPTGPYPAPPSRPSEDSIRNPAYLIKAKNGAVASENIVCSNVGVDVLKEGGNAVDAAIATTFCVGVVNFFS